MMQLKIKKDACFSSAEAEQLAGFFLVAMYCIPEKRSMENFFQSGKMYRDEPVAKPETMLGESRFAVRSCTRPGVMWISPDPARQFHDLYSYGNDPVNFVDPNGLYIINEAGKNIGCDEEGRYNADYVEAIFLNGKYVEIPHLLAYNISSTQGQSILSRLEFANSGEFLYGAGVFALGMVLKSPKIAMLGNTIMNASGVAQLGIDIGQVATGEGELTDVALDLVFFYGGNLINQRIGTSMGVWKGGAFRINGAFSRKTLGYAGMLLSGGSTIGIGKFIQPSLQDRTISRHKRPIMSRNVYWKQGHR